MKQLITYTIAIAINICELVYSCEQRASAEYISTNNNNKTKYILLQCKYDT